MLVKIIWSIFIEVLCHSDLETVDSFIYEMWNARNNIIFPKICSEKLYFQHLLSTYLQQ